MRQIFVILLIMFTLFASDSVNGCSCCAEGVGYHCGSRLDGCKRDGIYKCLADSTCFMETDCGTMRCSDSITNVNKGPTCILYHVSIPKEHVDVCCIG
jgi:hypothetical protein